MKQAIRNQHGLTLVEVMIAVAVASILFYGITSAIYTQMKNFQIVHNTIIRNELQNKIQKLSINPKLISQSINLVGNEKFKACFEGGTYPSCSTAPCCNNGFSGDGNDFVFTDPTVSNETFSGPPSSPKRYDINGVKCNTSSPQCPFVVTSSFSAICPGGVDPCNKAQSILVTYSFGMDQEPATGVRLPIQTGTVNVTMDDAIDDTNTDVEFINVDPSILAFCWTTGTECPTETYSGGSWIVKKAPVGVPIEAKKMLIEYWCTRADLNFREVGSNTLPVDSYLCFGNNPKFNQIGQAWVSLSSKQEYEFNYRSIGSNPHRVSFSVIGWSK